MTPIKVPPAHLNICTKVVRYKNNHLQLHCHCHCGCETFIAYKKKLSDIEYSEIRRADAIANRKVGFKTIHGELDKDGNPKTYIKHFFGLIKKEIHLPAYPIGAHINAVKIKCCDCFSEYILFDNRHHGYDARITKAPEEYFLYQVQFTELPHPCHIDVSLEYPDDASLPEDFISINIITRNSKGTRTVILSEETG